MQWGWDRGVWMGQGGCRVGVGLDSIGACTAVGMYGWGR